MQKDKLISNDQIKNAIDAVLHRPVVRPITGISTDTRQNCENKLFFPIEGSNFDGSDFLSDAIKAKCSAVVCKRDKMPTVTNDVGVFVVEDTLKAYQMLASFMAKTYNPKIIGITGSNGKSTSKVFLHNLLKDFYNCVVSEKSYNNNIGVPHTLLKIKKNTDVVVVEMGSNKKGDILELTKIVKPDIAAVTNVGNSHLAGLGSLSGVASEKKNIYQEAKIGVFNLDNEWTKKMHDSFTGEKVTYSIKSADVVFKLLDMDVDSLTISGTIAGVKGESRISIFGEHNLYNLMAASSLALCVGMKPEDIWNSMSKCVGIWGRNQLVKLSNGALVMFDAYNANPTSVTSMLSNVKKLTKKKLFLCLGDMLELGDQSQTLHEDIGYLAGSIPFEAIFFIGSMKDAVSRGILQSGFKKNLVVSDSYNIDLAARLADMLDVDSILFVKGSRGLKLENLVFDLKPLNFSKNSQGFDAV